MQDLKTGLQTMPSAGAGCRRRRSPWVVLALVASLSLCSAGCEDSRTIVLEFDRGNTDPTEHPFPDDRYLGAEILDAFNEAQLAALPFLRQLRFTAQTGYSPVTAIRIPFTGGGDTADTWVDVDTIRAGLTVYRLGNTQATGVPIGELSHDRRTNSIIVRGTVPWEPGRYAVVLYRDVVRTRDGSLAVASIDYNDVRDLGDPATDEGFALVAATDRNITSRDDTLAYWEFTVADQAAQMTLLNAYVNGAAPVDRDGTNAVLEVTPFLPVETRGLAVGGAEVIAGTPEAVVAVYAEVVEKLRQSTGAAPDEPVTLPSAQIDRIVGGAIAAPNFLSDTVADTQALFFNNTFQGRQAEVPFNPDNPLSLSREQPTKALPYLAFFPAPSPEPMPVTVFVHGISRDKTDLFTLANLFTSAGHAVIAIDLYQHGARQTDIDPPEGDFLNKLDPVLEAGGVAFPDPFLNPTFLARTRDKMRQSIAEQLSLIRLLRAGDGTNPLIDFDGDGQPDSFGDIHLVGHSLGSMISTVVAALSPELKRVVLNVPGGPLTQVVRESPFLGPDLDLLIYATANAPGFGLLGEQSREMLPDNDERELFSRVAETVIGAADPLLFAAAILNGRYGNGTPRLLIQLAEGDTVVPNPANIRFVNAVASGAIKPNDLVQVAPALFETGLRTVEAPNTALPPHAVTHFAGAHGFLIDFVDQPTTVSAQGQLIFFMVQD